MSFGYEGAHGIFSRAGGNTLKADECAPLARFYLAIGEAADEGDEHYL
jgi:hypothetical protein